MKRVLEGIKDEYRQLCNAFLKDSSVKNRTVGVGYISMRMRWPRAWWSVRARLQRELRCAHAGQRRLRLPVRLPAHPRRPRRLLRSREGARARGAAVHRYHRGDDRQDPRRRHRRRREGSPAAGAEAANVVEQPRGECYYYARGNGRSSSTACACARRRRRTWPAWPRRSPGATWPTST